MSSPSLIADAERVANLQWRVTRLEKFLDNNNDNGKVNEKIAHLNEEVARHAGNNKHARILNEKVDQINRLTSSSFQRSLMADRATKLELILADEQRIRHVTQLLTQIDQFAGILDGDALQDIPKLLASLHQLLIVHHTLKNGHGQFTQEISAFLQDYAAFTMTMDENLQQYRCISQKNDDGSSTVEDSPME